MRGGSWGFTFGSSSLLASNRYSGDPTDEGAGLGFRVATVPEPSAALLTIIGCALALVLRKRFK